MTTNRATIEYLKRCRSAKDAGYPVAYTTDPDWLIDMAINRRAGWPEADPHTHGIALLNHRGTLARKWAEDWQRHVRLFAREVNTPRLVVRRSHCPEARDYFPRLAHRLSEPGD